jgi:phenylacetate-CoA ligase
VTGEQFDHFQRETLANHFQVPVANGYGSRDGGFIAHECTHGRMHVMDPNVMVEIVDERGEEMPPGVAGEMVITHLDTHATPFIRYRTGDLGRWIDERCGCGRALSIVDVSAGRKTDHLVAADGRIEHALAAIYVLRELRSVDRFQIHQQRDRSIDVHLVPNRRYGSRDEARIVSGLQRRLGSKIAVRIHLADHLACAGSGKFRHVISDAVGDLASAAESEPTQEAKSPELQPA